MEWQNQLESLMKFNVVFNLILAISCRDSNAELYSKLLFSWTTLVSWREETWRMGNCQFSILLWPGTCQDPGTDSEDLPRLMDVIYFLYSNAKYIIINHYFKCWFLLEPELWPLWKIFTISALLWDHPALYV